MPQLVVGPVLRHVTGTSATIFVETDEACVVDVLGSRAVTFGVHGHHYALVVIEGLRPGSCTPYEVELDGAQVWPPPPGTRSTEFPPSVIRTPSSNHDVRIAFGSCRTAAPHEPPWTLELALDERGRGVDAMWAHALRMTRQDPSEWPHLMLMLGDQIYADGIGGFDEYCDLYQTSWGPEVERWFLSVTPTAMIFDDHDMTDDWNISESWVDEMRSRPDWDEHVIGGLMSYLVYQHLGNLSPDELRTDPFLAQLIGIDRDPATTPDELDQSAALEGWARASEARTPLEGGYRFSYCRDVEGVRVVVVDARNSRVLHRGRRSMLGESEWEWLEEQCTERPQGTRHLVLATSLPVFVPGALHDLQVWNESMCDGRWGRRAALMGERLRRSLDLEDWPAFSASFDRLLSLIDQVSVSTGREDDLASVCVLSGDIHFSYIADVVVERPQHRPRGNAGRAAVIRCPVHQVVCSPLRNALTPQERTVIRLASRRFGRGVGRLLRRLAGHRRSIARWELRHDPVFANSIGLATFHEQSADVVIEQAHPDDDGARLEIVLSDVLTTQPSGEHGDAAQPDRAGTTVRLSPLLDG